jgi:glycosyltransferase involved in cell wall biosynthesis
MAAPLISVITAVYNGESYLEECIQSILKQTHQEFEYLICNNHSTDRTAQIAGDHAARDPRIRVVSPPQFLPQVKNFNFAFQQLSPQAKYCKMVHADDWIYPQCLELMSRIGEENPRVDLVSAYRLIETQPDCFGVPLDREVFSGRDACRWYLLGTAFAFGSQTTVMYRADAVRRRWPRFFPEEDRFFFDVDVAFRMLEGRDFGFVHQVLTYSRYQPGAITDKASKYNAWFLALVVTVQQYGRELLTPEEFEQRWAEVTRDMYRGFGEVWLKDRVRRQKRTDFWEFQRKYLHAVGAEIEPSLLAKGVVEAGARLLTSPAELAQKLKQGARTRML